VDKHAEFRLLEPRRPLRFINSTRGRCALGFTHEGKNKQKGAHREAVQLKPSSVWIFSHNLAPYDVALLAAAHALPQVEL
jgi:hypothetical protein